MSKSNNSFIKKQKELIRKKKREEKVERKIERKKNATSGDLESMMAYVDEFGNITSTPPEKKKTELK
jgi:S-adenosylmethionine hydrolase